MSSDPSGISDLDPSVLSYRWFTLLMNKLHLPQDPSYAKCTLTSTQPHGALTDFLDGAPSTSGDPLPPRGLKEISSLASWTVSTSKPGCGVAALRHPSSSLFWQSDGPQPHLLTVHFFKQVAVAHIRIYLDFENDESYTPTRMQFWAGTGLHDLIEFADMQFEQPRGWIPVDFSQVGPIEEEDNEDPES
ncbi:galactose-binding like protein, partial [Aureobasidium melanogenum]